MLSAQHHPRRIVVMGRGGKTSLATAIGERFGLDFLELDSVVWLPDWQPSDRIDRTSIIEQWIGDHPDGWVIDGDTVDSTGRELTERADTVIWLDLPFSTVFSRVFLRTLRRVRSKTKVCGENYETCRTAAFSPNSLIYLHMTWLVNGRWRRHKRRLAHLLGTLREDQLGIRIRSTRELDQFYEGNGLTLPGR